MKNSRYTAEQIAFALTAGREWRPGPRGLSEDGDRRADLLPLEEEVSLEWEWRR